MQKRYYLKEISTNYPFYFTIHEFRDFLKISHAYAKTLLHQFQQSGAIISPAKGFYILVPEDRFLQAEEIAIYLFKHIKLNYYVSLLSAGSFFGTTQTSDRLQIISEKFLRHPLTFGNVGIDILKKTFSLNLPTLNFNFKNNILKVATPELIILDCFLYYRVMKIDVIANLFAELIDFIDFYKLVKLCEQTNNKHQLQRFGLMLEYIEAKNQKRQSILKEQLALYVKQLNPRYIDFGFKKLNPGSNSSSKWKIF